MHFPDQHCRQQRSKLHLAISLFLGIKICATISLFVQWRTLQLAGEMSSAQSIAHNVIRVVEMGFFIVVLMLIGAGWGIVDDNRAHRWPGIAGIAIAYIICYALELFFNSWLAISTAVALVAVLFFAYFSASDSIAGLAAKIGRSEQKQQEKQADEEGKERQPPQEQTADEEQQQQGASKELGAEEEEAAGVAMEEAAYLTQAKLQLRMLSRYRFAIALYIMGQLVCSTLAVFGLASWASQLVSQLVDLLLFACIEVIFRLHKERKHGMYYLLEGVGDVELDGEVGGRPEKIEEEEGRKNGGSA